MICLQCGMHNVAPQIYLRHSCWMQRPPGVFTSADLELLHECGSSRGQGGKLSLGFPQQRDAAAEQEVSRSPRRRPPAPARNSLATGCADWQIDGQQVSDGFLERHLAIGPPTTAKACSAPVPQCRTQEQAISCPRPWVDEYGVTNETLDTGCLHPGVSCHTRRTISHAGFDPASINVRYRAE